MKDENNFFIKQNIAYFLTKIHFIFGDIFFKILKNLITSAFFADADSKKHRYVSAKASNVALVKFTD